MAILPEQRQSLDVTNEQEIATPILRDYRITENGISGFVEGFEAIQQSVFKILATERFKLAAYDFNYGIELEDIIGKDREFVVVDIKRRFEEALLQVTGVQGIGDMTMEFKDERLVVELQVETIYGKMRVSEEVEI